MFTQSASHYSHANYGGFVPRENMKILLLFVMLHELTAQRPERMLSIDDMQEQLAVPENLFGNDELADDARILYEKKLPLRLDGLTELVKRVAGRGEIAVQSRSVERCSCETQYETRDLGYGRYPRYITASRCKPTSCRSKFHSCRLLHYMVHILLLRNPNENVEDSNSSMERQEAPLPEVLRHKWQMKPVSVPVACIPNQEDSETRA